MARGSCATSAPRYRGAPDGAVRPLEAIREAAQSATRGDDLLFVIGGDGSVRDAALGLAGSNTALAAVPAGTVNIWAKEAGIPNGLRAAVDAHITGQSVHIDLGRAAGQCFLLMAGIGWDAQVARNVAPWLKRHLGDIAYIIQAGWMLPQLRPPPRVGAPPASGWKSPLRGWSSATPGSTAAASTSRPTPPSTMAN